MTALWWILGAAAYLAVGGVFLRVALPGDQGGTEPLIIAGWPILMPPMVGMALAPARREARQERRHAREVAEAQHQVTLARLAAEEDALLDRRLRESR